MKISIITVSYNSEETIVDTIESVLQQSHPNIEYIIIDGGSSDSTLDVIKKYEPLFKGRMRWVSEKDNGQYDAINKGINMASGDIIGILNADDFFIDKYVIEDIVKIVKKAKADAVYADLVYVNKVDVNKLVRTFVTKKLRFRSGWTPPHPTVYVRRGIYDRLGIYNTEYKIAADYDMLYRLFEESDITSAYLNRVIIKMRLRGISTRNFKNIIKSYKESYHILKSHGEKYAFILVLRRLFIRLFCN